MFLMFFLFQSLFLQLWIIRTVVLDDYLQISGEQKLFLYRNTISWAGLWD